MRVFQLPQGQSVLFGLSWRAYDAFESRHGQIVEWQSQGFVWSANYKLSGGEAYVGLIDDSFEQPAKGKLYSAAALVATNKKLKGQTALVFFGSGTDAAIVGLLDGYVILDVCVPQEDVAGLRNEFAQRCAGKPFLTYGSEEFGQFDEAFDWGDLADSKSNLSGSRITKFKSDRPVWILTLAAALVTLIVIGVVAKGYFDEQSVKNAQAAALEANNPIRKYEEAVTRFVSDPKGVPQLAPNIKGVKKALGALQINRGGWSLVRVDCEMHSGSCVGEWTIDSSKVGTFGSFASSLPALPADWKQTYGPAFDRVTVAFNIPSVQEKLTAPATWPTFQSFMATEASRWQSLHALGLNVEVKAPEVQVLQSGVQASVIAANPNAIFSAGWSLAGRPWWLAEIFEKAPANVTLERIAILNGGSEITFNAEGKIYVRKN